MPHDEHKHECCEEVTKLLRTLVEVEVAQAEQLGRLSAKLETALCILERISRNTCETLNATDELLERSKELCPPPHHEHCGHEECGHEHHGGHGGHCGHCRHCGHCGHEHEHGREREPRCKYEPCERHGEEGGSQVSLSGSADPGRTFGAPYPPAERKPPPEGRANKHPAPDVPRGPFRGFLVPSDEVKPLDISSGGGGGGGGAGDDPVVFGKFTVYGTDSTARSTTAADISGAESGSVVMATANWYVSYSTDGGDTFTSHDPTTIFDNTADGGFCCDQIVQYAPSIDRFIWLMQFSTGTDGKNRLRIAAASPETVVSSKCTSWTYWDLTSDGLGVTTTAADATAGNHWLDYPNMSIGTNSLYPSVDNVGSGGATPPTGGRIVVRVPLSEVQAATTINYWYTHWEDGGVAYASHVSQNTGDEAYWAGNKNNSTLTVFSWNESSNTYFWRDVGVNNWPNSTLSSIAADGNDWLTKAASFPKFGVIDAARQRGLVCVDGQQRRGRERELHLPQRQCPGGQPGPHQQLQAARSVRDLEQRLRVHLSGAGDQRPQRGGHRAGLGRQDLLRQQRRRHPRRLRRLVPGAQRHLDDALGRLRHRAAGEPPDEPVRRLRLRDPEGLHGHGRPALRPLLPAVRAQLDHQPRRRGRRPDRVAAASPRRAWSAAEPRRVPCPASASPCCWRHGARARSLGPVAWSDNLDPAGRVLLPSAGVIVTTASGAKRLCRRRELAAAPQDVRRCFRWLPIGAGVDLAA